MRTPHIVLLSLLLAGMSPLLPSAIAAEPKVTGLSFPLGERSGENPAARVLVEQIIQSSQKRGVFRVALLPILVANGVAVTFYRLEPEALTHILETLQSLAKIDKLEMRHLTFLATGDPAPRLVAEEILVRAQDTWTLKRVQLVGRPGLAECQLILKNGPEGGLFWGQDEHLSLSELLGQKEPTPQRGVIP